MRIALVLAFAAMLASCSDPEAKPAPKPSTCVAYQPPAGTDLRAPVTSYKKDVAPIFARACNSASCHGDPSSSLIYLGTMSSTDDSEAVRKSLARPSDLLPSMPFVTPGKPESSFLQRKVDGDLCPLRVECTKDACGELMPLGEARLTIAERDTVRRWIAQGALGD